MDQIDLNIDNYTLRELEDLFSLHYAYNMSDVQEKKDNMCLKIMNDSSLQFETKAALEKFLENASNMLKNSLQDAIKDAAKDPVTSFADIRNKMIKGTNDMLIQDPFAAQNATPPLVRRNVSTYGTNKGVLNPVAMNTLYRGVNIDTRFRENYFTTRSTDLHITLPFRLEKIVSYRLTAISIPNTFYNISQWYGNNTLKIEVGASSYTLILPDGRYDNYQNATGLAGTDIQTVINSHLTNDTQSINNLVANLNLRYVIDKTSGKSIFAQDTSIAGTTAQQFTITFNIGYNVASSSAIVNYEKNIQLYLGWLLGFRSAKYTSSAAAGSYGSIVSEGACYLKSPGSAFLAIDDFTNNGRDYYISAYSNSLSVPNILARINLTQLGQISGSFQSLQSDVLTSQLNKEKRFFGPVLIQKLKITLYDDLGRILDLNNMDWQLELAFEYVYSN